MKNQKIFSADFAEHLKSIIPAQKVALIVLLLITLADTRKANGQTFVPAPSGTQIAAGTVVLI